jgi:Tol biopolymer transport system component
MLRINTGCWVLTLAASSALAAPGDTELVSIVDGVAAGGSLAGFPVAVSGEGRHALLFSSNPLYLGSSVAAGRFIVADRLTSSFSRAMPPAAGRDDASNQLSLSRDGRYLLIATRTSLTASDTNGVSDVYLRDLTTGKVELISATPAGKAADGESRDFSMSNDNRYIAFESYANDIDPAAPPARFFDARIYLHDRASKTTKLIPQNDAGIPDAEQAYSPRLSGNGRFVAFVAYGSRPALGDTTPYADVYVKDLSTGRIEHISTTLTGEGGTSPAYFPRISDDGRYVVFQSDAVNLAAGSDTNATYDIFLRDRLARSTERVSVGANGRQLIGGGFAPSLSADGTRVSFTSNDGSQAYVRDVANRVTKLVSRASDGQPANGQVYNTSITADGRLVFFGSEADNLAATDAVGTDVFVHEIGVGPDELPSTEFTVKPASVDFGVVAIGAIATRTFWLRNKAAAPLHFDQAIMRGDERREFYVTHDCDRPLALEESCPIRVDFFPITRGLKEVRLRVEVSGVARTREVSGTGR